MMCDRSETTFVRVKIMADLSFTEKEGWKDVKIDSCIAKIVSALQEGGIDMRSSCCGHGKTDGCIVLQDGRELIITKGWEDLPVRRMKWYEILWGNIRWYSKMWFGFTHTCKHCGCIVSDWPNIGMRCNIGCKGNYL